MPLSRSGLTVVKSLALDDFWIPANLQLLSVSDANPFQLRFGRLLTAAIDFTSLEELVLVNPTIGKKTISHNWRTGKIVRKYSRVSNDLDKYREEINKFLAFLSENLKERMQQYGNSRSNVNPTAISSWWENPIIKVMTKEKFEARFNQP